MSDFTERENDILKICLRITDADKPSEAVETFTKVMKSITYSEVIWVVDEFIDSTYNDDGIVCSPHLYVCNKDHLLES